MLANFRGEQKKSLNRLSNVGDLECASRWSMASLGGWKASSGLALGNKESRRPRRRSPLCPDHWPGFARFTRNCSRATAERSVFLCRSHTQAKGQLQSTAFSCADHTHRLRANCLSKVFPISKKGRCGSGGKSCRPAVRGVAGSIPPWARRSVPERDA